MADAKKKPESDMLGIVFKSQKPKQDDATKSPMEELYNRSLASISNPGKKDVRIFNVENEYAGKSLEAGTIVSDRKKDRPTLTQNIGEAFLEWQSTVADAFGFKPEKRKDTNASTPHAPLAKKIAPDTTLKDVDDSKKSQTIIPSVGVRTMVRDEETITETKKAVAVGKTARPLQSIRTLKSDSALVQPADATKAVAQIAPVKDTDLPKNTPSEPKQKDELPVPKPPASASGVSKIAPPQSVKTSAIATEEKTAVVTKKSIPTPPPDLRGAMIAPDVHTRMNIEASKFIPPQEVAKPAARVTPSYAFHLPDIVNVHKDSVVSQPRVSAEVPKPKTDGARPTSWTHTRADAPVPKIEPLPIIVPPVGAHDEVPLPPTLRETSVPIMADEARTIEHDAVVEPIPTPAPVIPNLPIAPTVETVPVVAVKPPEEQVSQREERITETTSNVPISTAIPTFHAPLTTVSLEEQKPVEAPASAPQQPIPPRPPVHKTHAPRSGVFTFAFILIGVLIVAGGLIVGGAYLFTQRDTTPDTSPDTTPTTLGTQEQTEAVPTASEVMLSETPALFLSRLLSALNEAPSGLTEIAIYTGTPLRNATAQEFFTHLEVSLIPRSIRALNSNFVVGSITTTQNEPFIVVRSLNFDALFAGLLDWEERMYIELSPLFGDAPITDARFVDAVRDNKSIRILQSADGQELLLYSFIDERTVIITKSGEALALLLNYY